MGPRHVSCILQLITLLYELSHPQGSHQKELPGASGEGIAEWMV